MHTMWQEAQHIILAEQPAAPASTTPKFRLRLDSVVLRALQKVSTFSL
jgi:hypothetical protein